MEINKLKKIGFLLLAFLLLLVGCNNNIINSNEVVLEEESVFDNNNSNDSESDLNENQSENKNALIEYEYYYSVEDVAEYIHVFGKLPNNYITKEEAKEIGWEADDDSGLVVGGNHFGNFEGLLPEDDSREYFEADISDGYTNHRGPKRIVFSNDGLIYYTEDHYESFEKLY